MNQRPTVRRCTFILMMLCTCYNTRPATASDAPVYNTEECSGLPWIIPFATGQTTLSLFANQRLDKLVTTWRADGGPLLASGRVDGQEDRPGQTLSSKRLRVVMKALTNRGVPERDLWSRDDHGIAGVAPNVAGTPEPQNRTVWIELPNQGKNCARLLEDRRLDWITRNCLVGGRGDQATCRSTLDLLK